MAGFFYNLGKMVGKGTRKANWVIQSLTGSDSDAVKAEHAVGRDIAEAYAKEMDMEDDPEVQRFLDQITSRLVECVAQSGRTFRVRAAIKEECNAFALPGGFIFIMRPLLELCDWNVDEIAFVIGHEMGHVIHKHSINRLMASSAVRAGMMRLPIGGLLGMGIMEMATELLSQGHSREQELEADASAVQLTHYAGFDGHGGIRMLERLNAVPSEKWFGLSYFSSHPPFESRITNIEETVRKLQSSQ